MHHTGMRTEGSISANQFGITWMINCGKPV